MDPWRRIVGSYTTESTVLGKGQELGILLACSSVRLAKRMFVFQTKNGILWARIALALQAIEESN
jgi:hypothetical protein